MKSFDHRKYDPHYGFSVLSPVGPSGIPMMRWVIDVFTKSTVIIDTCMKFNNNRIHNQTAESTNEWDP